MRQILGLVLSLFAALPVTAQVQDQTAFDVRFRGLTVAEIRVAARETDTAYAVAGRVEATGLVAVFARVRLHLAAQGHRAGPAHVPVAYSEDIDTGQRQSQVSLSWAGPIATVLEQSPPPGPGHVSPDDAAGAIDPLTALWRIMRSRPQTPTCDEAMSVYDGVRQSELRLFAPVASDRGMTCSGQYSRVAGFTPDEMNERRHFPFTAHYSRTDSGWLLTEVQTASLLGPIRIVRRN